ncbi:gamma-glutamyl-gamma-aminobutyrate hydrolase family protein [Halovulum dunhuangense]|uniref:gamma-glutamyl-gamma-aminobutyrate hydrolase n=1 Tax=Halovulum dunhuangense TaxID=1505036 RepID=A0A849L184_9RHOB|nr:gamma-glutamyl-gamma-aminobutyrate hydrolase family protein [Halovulum dunhuangense]NNU80046.1 gamma-glutamyl-gamma-aminobutyrate hydrolase family protein [Halovulum dunhuangense]
MARPVVGIIGNRHMVNDEYPAQAVGLSNLEAVAQVADALPLMIPAVPDLVDIAHLLDVVDGIVLTGGRPNVHPSHYGHEETEKHGSFDLDRDAVALGLIHACVDRGVPILGICRGFQEFNVAYGGTLHPEIRELPGRMNHRMPTTGALADKFTNRHAVHLTPGGLFARLFGADVIEVNTLHGQGIETPGTRIVIEGHAPDGTPEALHVKGAPNFAMAVQWHPEWQAGIDPVSRPLFQAFGTAMRKDALRRAG